MLEQVRNYAKGVGERAAEVLEPGERIEGSEERAGATFRHVLQHRGDAIVYTRSQTRENKVTGETHTQQQVYIPTNQDPVSYRGGLGRFDEDGIPLKELSESTIQTVDGHVETIETLITPKLSVSDIS